MTEEKLIKSFQQMYLIYSQLGTLHYLIARAARLASGPAGTLKGPHVDGVIGYVSQIDQLTQQMGQVYGQNSQTTTGHAN